MEIRFERHGVAVTDDDQRDPVTGRRMLVIVEIDQHGQRTGHSLIVPLDDKQLQALHEQTSPLVRISRELHRVH